MSAEGIQRLGLTVLETAVFGCAMSVKIVD